MTQTDPSMDRLHFHVPGGGLKNPHCSYTSRRLVHVAPLCTFEYSRTYLSCNLAPAKYYSELEVFIEHIPRAERLHARMHAVQLQST